MLVCSSTAGILNAAAHTGPPAWASAAFRPIARSSVLFPDMFDPVTRSSVPAGPMLHVVGDAPFRGDQRMRQRGRGIGAGGRLDLRHDPVRLVGAGDRQRGQRIDGAEGREPGADVNTRSATPSLHREQHVEIPHRQRLHRKVQDGCAATQLRPAGERGEATHGRGCRLPVAHRRAQPRQQRRRPGGRQTRSSITP